FFRQLPEAGLARAHVRVEAHALPALPALPWHVADPARFAAECRLLHAAGFLPAIAAGGNGERPGLSLSLRRDGQPFLTVLTPPGYPHEPPALVDRRGRAAARLGRWSADRFLIDV